MSEAASTSDTLRSATPEDTLLATKLYIPRAHTRHSLVQRSHLVQRLIEGTTYPLILISAPAGFGKSTLLSEWIPQNEHCVT